MTQGHGPIQICSLNDLVKNSDSVHGSKRCWLIHRCFNWKGTKASVSLKQCSAVWNNVKVISLTVSVGCRRVLTWPPGILWAVPPDPHDSALKNAVPVLATSLPEHGNTPTLYPPTTHTLATTTWTRGGVSDRGKPKEREELVLLVLKEKSKAVKKKNRKHSYKKKIPEEVIYSNNHHLRFRKKSEKSFRTNHRLTEEERKWLN